MIPLTQIYFIPLIANIFYCSKKQITDSLGTGIVLGIYKQNKKKRKRKEARLE